jgi:hypothetical protein
VPKEETLAAGPGLDRNLHRPTQLNVISTTYELFDSVYILLELITNDFPI